MEGALGQRLQIGDRLLGQVGRNLDAGAILVEIFGLIGVEAVARGRDDLAR